MCAFLAWFMLGAINESAPLAFSLVPNNELQATTEQSVMALSASLACGSFLSVLIGGYMADWCGRLAVIRPSLLMTIGSGMMMQMSHNLTQAIAARFLLGLSSGALFAVIPPLIAELLPSRHRGFYLTIWCCGWPLGGLMSVLMAYFLPGMGARVIYSIVMVPAMLLYVCTRAEMLPESPRYLYLVGRRDEGYVTLMDMYEKQLLPLPWSPETIAVHTAPSRDKEEHRFGMSSSTGVMLCLAFAMFAVSAAAQSMKLWMPTMLVAQQADVAQLALSELGPHAMFSEAFAGGPVATSMLSVVRAPLMLRQPHFTATMVLLQGYIIQFCGIVACAYTAHFVSRKNIVQWSLLAAAAFTLSALGVANAGFLLLVGPLVGMQLAAQSCCFNFLQVFASEHFPTSSRAKTTAFVVFMAQLGNFTIPVLGGIVVRKVSATGAILFFGMLYLVAWIVSRFLPLPTGREQPLHDLEEPAPSRKGKQGAGDCSRKKEWMSYQSTC